MSYNIPESTLLESWLSRGDRRLGAVIMSAWRNGAKFDAWNERDNLQLWRNAFAENQLNPDFYAYRERNLDEILPWEHIDIGVSKRFLQRDYQWSLQGRTRQDCRNVCFSCGDQRPPETICYWGCP